MFASFLSTAIPGTVALINRSDGKAGWSAVDTPCLQEQLDTQGRVSGNFYKWISVTMWLILPAFGLTLSAILLTLWRILKSTQVDVDQGKLFKLLITFMTGIAILMIWLCISLLFYLRTAMCIVAGDTWSEAKFGFGQAVALLTWVPAGTAFFYGLWKTQQKSKRR